MVQATKARPPVQNPKTQSKPRSGVSWGWFLLSLFSNLLLSSTLVLWFLNDRFITSDTLSMTPLAPAIAPVEAATPKEMLPGERRQLTYQDWVALLDQEAKVTIRNKPEKLMVLAGDSLSLWFPTDLLPAEQTWLNQSISGDTSSGLLRRLNLFAEAEPQAIFVMIGINDLTKGITDQQLIDNYLKIVQQLQQNHPDSKIVLQSILPHGGDRMTSEKREKLLTHVPIRRIFQLNTRLATIARNTGVQFLDLQPLFADNTGFLRSELSTDGLHLSKGGYLVWRSAIQTFTQLANQPQSVLPKN
jgi:lysophospholipase L1-like esterase